MLMASLHAQVWISNDILHHPVRPEPGPVGPALLRLQPAPVCRELPAAGLALWPRNVLRLHGLPPHQRLCRLDVAGLHRRQSLCQGHLETEGRQTAFRTLRIRHHRPHLGLCSRPQLSNLCMGGWGVRVKRVRVGFWLRDVFGVSKRNTVLKKKKKRVENLCSRTSSMDFRAWETTCTTAGAGSATTSRCLGIQPSCTRSSTPPPSPSPSPSSLRATSPSSSTYARQETSTAEL